MIFKVLDIATNQPIPGAYLYTGPKSSPLFATFTNDQGTAEIDNSSSFRVSHVAYIDYEVFPGPGSIIYLEPKINELPGVTVTAARPANMGMLISLLIIGVVLANE